MKYKAIVLDIDGTLTKMGPDHLRTQKVIDTLKEAEGFGVIIALATGRPIQFTESLLDVLNIHGYVIVDNGAAIYEAKKKTCIWESLLDNKAAKTMLVIAKKYQSQYGIGMATSSTRLDKPKEITKDMKVRKINVRALA